MVMRSALLASAVTSVQGAHFAVLVAGSNTYGNYRHQADVCHSYHVVKANGIPDENIIVMAYDDIANNSRNPFPGKMFNQPTAAGVEGKDVYEGCKIDYSGTDVNPANFLNVLTGTGNGKVLKSTADDNVFVFFSDHGAPGLIAFPTGAGVVHKADLQSAFDTMHSKKMYKKLVMYLETCESGSMFEGLTTPNVYALSAANPTESSWGSYCGSDAMVNGKSVGSCLGDLFSIAWMEDSDATDIATETLDAQFTTVRTRVSKSQVLQWGELGFKTDKVSDYQGTTNEVSLSTTAAGGSATAWNAREIDLRQAYERYASAPNAEERFVAGEELQAALKDQLEIEAAYERFLEIVYPGDASRQEAARTAIHPADQKECELSTRASFVENGDFDSWTGFAMQFHRYIVNVCADVVGSGANIDLTLAAKQACAGTTIV